MLQKQYQDKHIVQCIFKEKINNDSELNEYLIKSFYISLDYIKYLKNKINKENINSYKHTLSWLIIDIEQLIASIEIIRKKSTNNKTISLHAWRKTVLTPIEIYEASKRLFFIEENDKIVDLYLKDLKPVVMFQIRQVLEVFGRSLLGYYSIKDSSGNAIKKFTQISWKFINEELKKPNPNIELPFDLLTILAINSWSNNFVHSTLLYSSYIQYFALKTINCLFHSDNTEGIQIYNGYIVKKNDCADIKITNYNTLKNDFEVYLRSENKSDNIFADWMNVEDVGAYIISL